MSKNPSDRREVIVLEDFPRSGTPEPAPKRQRTSRSSSTKPGQDSSRSQVSRAGATKRPKVSQAGTSATTSFYIILEPTTFGSHGPSGYRAITKRLCDGHRDSSDRKSPEADTEARPGMTALTSKDPSDRESQRLMPRQDLRWAPLHQRTLRIVSPQRLMPRQDRR